MSVTFTPTHVVPDGGLHTWAVPDGSTPAGPPLPGFLPVAVHEQRGRWVWLKCSNGWRAWTVVDTLVALDQPVGPTAARTPVRVGKVIVSVPLLSGLALVVSTVLAWFSSPPLGIADQNAYDFPVALLTDRTVIDPNSGFLMRPGGTSIGAALAVLGVAAVVVSQTRLPAWITHAIGWGVLVMATLFVTQVQRGMGQLIVARVFSVLGPGVYVAAVAGLVMGLSRGSSHEEAGGP